MRWYSHGDTGISADDEEESRTKIESPTTQIGEMMDFLKTYPFITMEQYYWGLSIPMIRLMAYDATKIHYLSEKQAKKQKAKKNAVHIDDPMDLRSDIGAPIFKPKEE